MLMLGVLLNSFVVALVLRFARCSLEERENESHPVEETVPCGVVTRSSLTQLIYQSPLKVVIFQNSRSGSGSGQLAGDDQEMQEDEEENVPEWRHWF